MSATVGVIAIGRNEGARLVRCLKSLDMARNRVVYVDSGSTDGSPAAARDLGAEVVTLDMRAPFTAARARNAGFDALRDPGLPDYVQFIDGDCEMDPAWIATARGFLDAHPQAAAVCGRLRERHPDASIYNRLCDMEWNADPGPARACGGIVMMRTAAFDAAGGFNPDLIAGEEPELCVRLRAAGWQIWRIADEMALHDAAMTRLGQWWTRARRGGYAAAEGAAMHGAPPERHRVHAVRSALLWGGVVPLVALLGLLVTPWSLALLLAWPAQVLRLWRRGAPLERAFFLVLAKLPEAQGVLHYAWGRQAGRRARLIEYK